MDRVAAVTHGGLQAQGYISAVARRPSGLADELAGETGGLGLAVAPDDGAVHDDQVHAGRLGSRGAVDGEVGDPAGADDADVGGHAGGQATAVAQAVDIGGVGGQVPGQALVSGAGPVGEVVPGDAGERAVAAAVGVLALVDAVGPGAVPVAVRQPGQVVLSQPRPVQMRADVEPGVDQQVQYPFAGGASAGFGRCGDRLPGEVRVGGGQAAEVDVLQEAVGELLAC